MYFIGVDIGGTTVKAGVVDEAGFVIRHTHIQTEPLDWAPFLSNLLHLIRQFRQAFDIRGIGIGVPGLLNAGTREILAAPNLPFLAGVGLEACVADDLHLPVIADNDANAAAYGEFTCGEGAGSKDMVYLTLGTGLGSGVIINGRLLRGFSGYAAEFGHTVIQPGGRVCGCGSTGCLETLVSASGIVRTARESMASGGSGSSTIQEPWTAKAIAAAADAGDAAAIAVFQETGRWLGIACGNLINLLNPQRIVLGGGVMAAGSLLMPSVLASARQTAIAAPFRDCQIVQSKLGTNAGVIGAAMLARDTPGSAG